MSSSFFATVTAPRGTGRHSIREQLHNSNYRLNDAKREIVRRIVFEAFGKHFVIDPTKLGTLRIRLSDKAPRDVTVEKGLHHEAVLFHGAATALDGMSDGVKAFVGTIAEVVAGDPSVLIVDEPEAFLHPPLVAKLGNELARAANESDKQVFAATHSPHFIMGCVQSGAPTTIVRLTYKNGVATSNVIPGEQLRSFMRQPLLRSTSLLSALFFESVIVAEADTDRAFYQEINERLLQAGDRDGIVDCAFLNAQNKQTIPTLLAPLRSVGIPAAAILDIDVIKEGGPPWASLLSSAGVPKPVCESLSTLRALVKNAFDNTGKDMKREGGISLLSGESRQSACHLLEQLREFGIFIVPLGEVESWLKELGTVGHGPNWLVNTFQRMGEDPTSPSYVRPGHGDVWQLLTEVRTWLLDPQRKGMHGTRVETSS